MPFIAVPLTAKVIIETTVGGIPCFNVMHVSGDSAMTDADVTYLAEHIHDAYETRIMPLQSDDTSTVSTEVVALDSSSAPGATFLHSVAGSETPASVPANACYCASWHVPTRYRGGHSRSYVSGWPNTFLATPATLVAFTAGVLQAAWADFRSDVNGLTPPDCAPVELVVVHWRRGGVALTPPETEAISGVTVSTNVTTQRRRLRA